MTTRQLNFIPIDFGGCVLWLRSDLGVSRDPSNNVSQWDDQSGQGNHVTVPPGFGSPAYAQSAYNNRPCLRFLIARSTALYKANTNLIGTGPYTMALVHQQLATAASAYTFGNTNSTGGTGGMAFGLSSSTRNVLHQNVANHTDGVIQTTLPEVWVATYDGSTVPVFYLNGVPTTVTGTNGMLSPAAAGAIAVGAFVFGATPSSFASADVMEGMIFTRVLTTAELATLHAYLISRYAIQLP